MYINILIVSGALISYWLHIHKKFTVNVYYSSLHRVTTCVTVIGFHCEEATGNVIDNSVKITSAVIRNVTTGHDDHLQYFFLNRSFQMFAWMDCCFYI